MRKKAVAKKIKTKQREKGILEDKQSKLCQVHHLVPYGRHNDLQMALNLGVNGFNSACGKDKCTANQDTTQLPYGRNNWNTLLYI